LDFSISVPSVMINIEARDPKIRHGTRRRGCSAFAEHDVEESSPTNNHEIRLSLRRGGLW
jgi:hypothetical protein